MKIAIPCTGLDHVRRGFESFARELFENLRGHCDAHLIKGTGAEGEKIHVMRCLRRDSPVYRFLPRKFFTEYRRLQIECVTFGRRFLPLIAREPFDLVHFSDVALGDFLLKARKKSGAKFRLLFSNGAPWEPAVCARFDAVHQVSPAHFETGRSAGVENSFLVPYGLDTKRLRTNAPGRDEARSKLGLPRDAFVVVSLAALNRTHKRVDWLVREFSKLDPAKFFLAAAGHREKETREIEELAARELPRRNFTFLQLAYENVPQLLRASDLFALCSLDEGFGRVIAEAMAAGLPVLVHPHATARWIVRDERAFVDMTAPGALAERILFFQKNDAARREIAAKSADEAMRFDWDTLVPDYLRMYEAVLKK